jgi:hypothetical protein
MENTPFWFLVVTAVAIPVGNAVFAGILGLVGARVGRNATRYAAELQAGVNRENAELQAAQRCHDVEIAHLRDAEEALFAAATAIQSYTWYANERVKAGIPITTEEWIESRSLIDPAIHGAQKLRAIAPTLPSESLRDAYIAVERLIFKVVHEGIDAWSESVKNQPDPITRAISETAGEIRELLQTYPVEVPARPASPPLPPKGQNRSITS